jgi:hypothetical protein
VWEVDPLQIEGAITGNADPVLGDGQTWYYLVESGRGADV